MGSKGTKHFIEWLAQNTQIKKLSLARNNIGDKSAVDLSKILTDSIHNLKKLDIKLCDIGSKPLKEICSCVGGNKKLEELDLSGNTLKKKAGEALCESIDLSRSIQVLNVRNCSLAKQTVLAIIKSARRHSSLRTLDLAMNNEVGTTEVLKEIEELLSQPNSTIQELNLAAVQLSGTGLAYVTNGLGKNASLKKLHLDANRLGKYTSKITQAIITNSNCKLEEVTLKNVEVSKKEAQEFFRILLDKEFTLRNVAMDRNDLEKSQFEDILKHMPNLSAQF